MNVFKQTKGLFPDQLASTKPIANVPVKPSPRASKKLRSSRKQPGNLKVFCLTFLMYLIGIFPSMVFALPSGGTIQAGSANIDSSSSSMVIQQSTDKAIIDWRSFSIDTNEQVQFKLPSSNGVTLNRVTGNEQSGIFGQLSSNGNLMLINPNGILFGDGARVDVHGLIATTSNISNENFMAGQYQFDAPSLKQGVVVNRGLINASQGGLVALVAPGVINEGIINARMGRVTLAAGNIFTLDLYGDQLVNLGVSGQVMGQITGLDGQSLTSLVSNTGGIYADGGTVRLNVNAASGIVDQVINMEGIIQARSIEEQNGVIILSGGDYGEVSVSGTLDASGYSAGETGGTVHVLGDQVSLYGTAVVDVSGDLGGGELLFGGDYQGKGVVQNASETYVAREASIYADAITFGDGGRAIFWADRRTRFLGRVNARGGREGGNGGLVEVSGKEELYFDGLVDTTAPNGETGLLLLDPENIVIVDGSGATASGTATFTFSEQTLEAVSATTNISLIANNSIIMRDLNDNVLNLKQTSGHSVTFTATEGSITFASINDTIQTAGGDLSFLAGGDLTLGSLDSNGGDITLLGTDLILFGSVNAGTGDLMLRASKNRDTGGTIGLGGISIAETSTLCNGAACDFTVDATELQNMTAKNLYVGPQSISGNITSGDIFVSGLTSTETGNISGEVFLRATHISGSEGTITFNGNSTFSALSANAVNGIVVNGNLTTSSGNMTLNGDTDDVLDNNSIDKNNIALASGTTLTSAGDLTLKATTHGISAAGAVNLSAASAMTLDSLTATGSAILIAGTGISLGSGAVLTSGNTLSLSSTTGSISGDGALTMSAVNGISLSNSVIAAGNLSLDGTNSITLASGTSLTSTGGSMILNGGIAISSGTTLTAASGITLNDSLTTAGTTTIDADSNDDGIGDLTLASGKTLATGNNNLFITANDIILAGSLNSGTAATSISVSDGGSLGIGSVNCGSSCGMTLDATEMANITENGLSLAGSSIYFAAGQSLSSTGVLTLGSSGGSIIGAGDLTLSGTNGLVLTSSTLTSGGTLTLGDTNGAITTGGAATLNAVSGVTINNNFTAGGAVVVDADSDDNGTGDFTLASGKTLSTSNNGLTITSNDIFLTGSINSGTGSTTLLVSDSGSMGLGATIGDWTLSGDELQRLTAGNLVIGSSTNGSITVDNITSTNSGNVSGTLTLNSGSSVSFANNASVFQGGLVVSAETGVNLLTDLTTAGTTSLDADSNDDGIGDLTLASALNSANNTISLIGADFVLTGSVNSGTAGTSIETSKAGNTIGLGVASADMTIDSSELAMITAGSRTFGGSANGGITVDSLTVTDPLTLLATRSGSSVDFQGSSSFGNLTVNTGGSITDSTGSLSVSGTSSFTGSQGITLDNTSNAYSGVVDLSSSGGSVVFATNSALILGTSSIGNDLTVSGGNAITVNGVQDAGGKIFFTAESDITLTGSLVSASSSLSAIQLASTTGGIFDGDTTGALDIDAPTGGLVVDVVSGFGTELNALETRVASVDIDNSTSGEINIFETDSLNVINIMQNADPGDILVSYSGALTGEENALALNGSISFIQRVTADSETDGALSNLSLATTVKLAGEIQANYFPDYGSFFSGDNSVSSGLTATASQGFVADVFSEDFELVEMARGNRAKKRLKGLSSFWGPMIDENEEVVKKPRRSRSGQEAKRKGKSRKGKINKVEKKPKAGAKVASRSIQPREKPNDGNSSSLFSSFLNLFR